MRCLDWEFQVKVDPKLPFWVKNQEIGKNQEIKKKTRQDPGKSNVSQHLENNFWSKMIFEHKKA